MIVRKAKISDIPKIMILQKELISFERRFDASMRRDALYYPRKQLAESIKSANANLLVVADGNTIYGCCFGKITKSEGWDAHPKKGYIGLMYMHDVHRSKGYGKKMMQELLNCFGKKGIKELQLNVYPKNDRAVLFYRSFGFEPHLMYMRKLSK